MNEEKPYFLWTKEEKQKGRADLITSLYDKRDKETPFSPEWCYISSEILKFRKLYETFYPSPFSTT